MWVCVCVCNGVLSRIGVALPNSDAVGRTALVWVMVCMRKNVS